jgi:hypothetical protein
MEKVWRRILERSKPDPNSECVLWTGAKNDGGYGYLKLPRDVLPELPRVSRVHRIVYYVIFGFDLDLTLDHTCHQRACVNPYHLQPVTVTENAIEANHYRWYGEGLDEEWLDDGF